MARAYFRTPLRRLRADADALEFPPHRIGHLLDAKGRHEIELPGAFPFAVSRFHFREGAVTQRMTWHERLELLVPLDGPLRERMGDLLVDLGPGDILVVDHLKPHQVVDVPGLNTRVLVISFLAECVFAPGCPPADSAFLLPFFAKVEGRAQVLRAQTPLAGEAHEAIRRLMGCYFGASNGHWAAGCKAWLMVLLHALIQEFRHSAVERAERLKRQEQVARLKPLFDHVREHYADLIALGDAAALCGMSRSVFGRAFKTASGMTLRRYLNHVRLTHALELLERTGEGIAGIASRLGFSDQSHFDRRFREMFGRTPSQHRNESGRVAHGAVRVPHSS